MPQDSKASGRDHIPDFQGTAPSGVNYLLVIAIDAYVHCPRLYNCVKDAHDLIELLTERYHFERNNFKEIFNAAATRANIYNAFRNLAQRVTPNDNLLIYFSGHGEYDPVLRRGFWIPVDAKPGDHYEYISNSDIKDFLSAIHSHHTFLMADSCFAGALFAKGVTKNITKRYEKDPSRWGLTAGRNEIVSDGKPGDNSPFAESLLYRLCQNTDALGVMELCAHVVEQVQAKTNQTPIGEPLKVEGHKNGQFVFHVKQDETRDWEAAQKENTIAAYTRFWRSYPNGIHYQKARQKIRDLEEEEDWQKALRRNKVSDYEAYLEEYPSGKYIAEAHKNIDAILNGMVLKTPEPKIILPEKPKLDPPRLPFEPEMVFVQGGTFKMGSNDYDEEKPIHKVTVKDFYIGKYPVTFAEYDAFCEATNREKPADKDWGRDRRPVIYVSWNDAQDYCKWLSEKNRKNYRLPSEAEWEYAARGGANSEGYEYAGSNYIDEVAWYNGNSGRKTHPVGTAPKANELGIYDMSGNVWEWCEDVWHNNYEGAPKDGSAWISGGNQARRVVRGGSWNDFDNFCRVSNRYNFNADSRNDYRGFRLAGY